MRFGVIGPKRPENFPKLFHVYKGGTGTTARGRVKQQRPELIGEMLCTLSIAKPEEQQRFNQMGVTVTHTIFHPGPPVAKKDYALALAKDGTHETRFFRVEAVHDKGELDVFTTYYCEERGDINGIWNQSDGNGESNPGTGESGASEQSTPSGT